MREKRSMLTGVDWKELVLRQSGYFATVARMLETSSPPPAGRPTEWRGTFGSVRSVSVRRGGVSRWLRGTAAAGRMLICRGGYGPYAQAWRKRAVERRIWWREKYGTTQHATSRRPLRYCRALNEARRREATEVGNYRRMANTVREWLANWLVALASCVFASSRSLSRRSRALFASCWLPRVAPAWPGRYRTDGRQVRSHSVSQRMKDPSI